MTQPYQLQNKHEALNHRLKQALRFSEEDLVANRAGQLAPRQQGQLRTEGGGSACMIWVGGLLCVLLICIVITNTALPPKKDFAALLPALGLGVLAIVSGLVTQKGFTQDIQNNSVMKAQGPIKKRCVRVYRRRHYYIDVDRTSLQVPYEIYEAFVEGQSYILYYTLSSMTLMAAEHILETA